MRRATMVVLVLAVATIGLLTPSATAQISGRAGAAAPGGPCGDGLYDPYGYRRYYYSPYIYRSRPRVHAAPNETGLRYYRHNYPYFDYDYYRRTYPHTFSGTFAERPRPRDLTLRFRIAPGYSPFSRYHHDEALFGDGPADPRSPQSEDYESGALSDLFRDIAVPWTPAPKPAPAPSTGEDDSFGHQIFVPSNKPPSRAVSADEQRAWNTLAAGKGRRAEERFGSLALAYPSLGRPKAGFALSRAIQGDDENAVWNMRRAVKIDGASLTEVPMSDALEGEIRRLLARYADGGSHDVSETDATFMTAALHFLLGEPAAARDAVRAAVEGGDVDRSTLRLLMLLREGDGPEGPRPNLRARNAL